MRTLSAWLGDLMLILMPSRRVTALENLSLALGQPVSDPGLGELARASFRHFARCVLEILHSHFWPTGRSLVLVGDPSGSAQAIETAAAEGKGVLLMTGHLGNWEVGCRYFGEMFPGRFAVVAKRLRPAWLDRFVVGLRSRSGTEVIPKDQAARGVLRALREGKIVAVLMDQNRPEGVFAPFFGRLAATSPLVPMLAARTQSPVLPTAVTRTPDGLFELSVLPPLHFEGDFKEAGSLEAAVARCNGALETMIRRHPEQWLWSHRRFKTAPPGM